MKCLIYMTDKNGVVWYFKSKYLSYNWTTDIDKAKWFPKEKDARTMIRELYLYDGGLYKFKYIEK